MRACATGLTTIVAPPLRWRRTSLRRLPPAAELSITGVGTYTRIVLTQREQTLAIPQRAAGVAIAG